MVDKDSVQQLVQELNKLEQQVSQVHEKTKKYGSMRGLEGEMQAVMALTIVFKALKDQFTPGFNTNLSKAKGLFPNQTAVQNMKSLDMGPPDRNFDVYDVPLALEQMEEMKVSIAELMQHIQLAG